MCVCCVQTFQEVQQREEIVARKEAMLSEKRELEMKKLRSSQVLSKVEYCLIVHSSVPQIRFSVFDAL